MTTYQVLRYRELQAIKFNSLYYIYKICCNQIISMPSIHPLTFLLLLLTIHETQCIMSLLTIPSEQVLVSDISHQILVHRVAPILNTTYLSNFEGEIKTQYKGVIFGWGRRALVNVPIRFSSKRCPIQINVIFKVDTGAPISTLTTEVLQKLYANCPKIEQVFLDRYKVKIAGYKITVHESQAHYQTLNIIGADFLSLTNSRLQMNYSQKKAGYFKLLIQGYQ